MLSTQSQINYDRKFDVLYYNIGDTSNSYGDEIDSNIILLKDIETDHINGVTVLDFLKKCVNDSEKAEVLQNYFDVQTIVNRLKN